MCWLTGFGTFDVAAPPAGVAAVCPAGEILLLHPGLIRQAHQAGRDVYAWWSTLETAPGNEVLAAFGVDGLIVDDLRSVPAG